MIALQQNGWHKGHGERTETQIIITYLKMPVSQKNTSQAVAFITLSILHILVKMTVKRVLN